MLLSALLSSKSALSCCCEQVLRLLNTICNLVNISHDDRLHLLRFRCPSARASYLNLLNISHEMRFGKHELQAAVFWWDRQDLFLWYGPSVGLFDTKLTQWHRRLTMFAFLFRNLWKASFICFFKLSCNDRYLCDDLVGFHHFIHGAVLGIRPHMM